MRNSNKKGFTIVELVIVIAVIAILAAVLIPTFSGIIKKANMSADQKALHDMNTAIAMESAETLEEAIAALEKHKINAKNLIPVSAGYSFIWNNATKQLEIVEGKVDESVDEAKKNIAVAVNSTEAFIDAINDDLKYIKLEADVVINEAITIRGGNVTLDLGGKKCTTTQTNVGDQANARSLAITVAAEASLTITNGTFEGRAIMNYGTLTIKDNVTINAIDYNGGGCVRNKEGGTVIIEGGTFNAPTYAPLGAPINGGAAVVHNEKGTVTINGGKFNSGTTTYAINNIGGTLTINKGTFTAHRGAVATVNGNTTINGGTFSVTNGEQSGWVVSHNADISNGTGTTIINGGEFTSVVNNRVLDNTGDVIDNR